MPLAARLAVAGCYEFIGPGVWAAPAPARGARGGRLTAGLLVAAGPPPVALALGLAALGLLAADAARPRRRGRAARPRDVQRALEAVAQALQRELAVASLAALLPRDPAPPPPPPRPHP